MVINHNTKKDKYIHGWIFNGHGKVEDNILQTIKKSFNSYFHKKANIIWTHFPHTDKSSAESGLEIMSLTCALFFWSLMYNQSKNWLNITKIRSFESRILENSLGTNSS